jgi:putative addiction module CopG family antidote
VVFVPQSKIYYLEKIINSLLKAIFYCYNHGKSVSLSGDKGVLAMQIEFQAAEAQYIKDAVANGYYENEAEAVQAAVQMLREETEAKRTKLYAALAEGEEDVKAGRVDDYTPELLDGIFAEAIAMVERGEKIELDPNVIP